MPGVMLEEITNTEEFYAGLPPPVPPYLSRLEGKNRDILLF